MRFLRIGPPGKERPGVLAASGEVFDLGSITSDIDARFLASEPRQRVQAALDAGDLPVLEVAGQRIGAPIALPGKVVCVGLNYRDHAAETGADVPSEPILFLKAPDTVVGPDDEVLVPRGSRKTDWEVELAVVIGRRASYLASPDEAGTFVAGYAISNDLSEREFQLERGGQWDKGKSCATFNPMGPWLVTPDEVGDTGTLGLRLWVNDELRQDGSTKDMVFGVEYLIWYISQFMVLEPGDVINTGTPAGVALGRAQDCYLRGGETLTLEIDGLGRQHQPVGRA